MKYELGQILILQFSVDQEGIEESRLNLDWLTKSQDSRILLFFNKSWARKYTS